MLCVHEKGITSEESDAFYSVPSYFVEDKFKKFSAYHCVRSELSGVKCSAGELSLVFTSVNLENTCSK